MDIVVGSAGHIDHGKTALIKALTGVDADRLPEEKQRGITIDLGFAELDVGDVRIGFVDVPGHEKFVKNMLAGVSGIDLVMLVVAADEGVMQQTREHFDICRLLNVRSGLVVLTKSDLVDEETMELARLDVAELVQNSFLEDAPVLTSSARTGDGIEDLKRCLQDVAKSLGPKKDDHVTRLHIDRRFTVKGFGPVVTGTLVSGKINSADELELMPEGQKVRVRGLQTYGRGAESVHSGQRAAVNLAGIDHTEISRGMLLTERGVLRPTQILDAEIEVLRDAVRPVRTRQRVRVHIGTVEALARISVINASGVIEPGATDLVQIRLEAPVAAIPGERFIIRQYSPQLTIAGGRVLDAMAERHRRKDIDGVRERLVRMAACESDHTAQISIFIEAAGRSGLSTADLQARTGLRRNILADALAGLVERGGICDAGDHSISAGAFQELTDQTLDAIGEFHKQQPLAKGMPIEALRESVFAHVPAPVIRAVVERLGAASEITIAGEFVGRTGYRTEMSADERTASERIRAIYMDAGFEVPRFEDVLAETAAAAKMSREQARKLFQLHVDSGAIVKVTDEFYFAASAIDALTTKLRDFASATSDSLIDVAQFKEITGLSRKYSIPLLEHFDRTRVTVRTGDKRRII